MDNYTGVTTTCSGDRTPRARRGARPRTGHFDPGHTRRVCAGQRRYDGRLDRSDRRVGPSSTGLVSRSRRRAGGRPRGPASTRRWCRRRRAPSPSGRPAPRPAGGRGRGRAAGPGRGRERRRGPAPPRSRTETVRRGVERRPELGAAAGVHDRVGHQLGEAELGGRGQLVGDVGPGQELAQEPTGDAGGARVVLEHEPRGQGVVVGRCGLVVVDRLAGRRPGPGVRRRRHGARSPRAAGAGARRRPTPRRGRRPARRSASRCRAAVPRPGPARRGAACRRTRRTAASSASRAPSTDSPVRTTRGQRYVVVGVDVAPVDAVVVGCSVAGGEPEPAAAALGEREADPAHAGERGQVGEQACGDLVDAGGTHQGKPEPREMAQWCLRLGRAPPGAARSGTLLSVRQRGLRRARSRSRHNDAVAGHEGAPRGAYAARRRAPRREAEALRAAAAAAARAWAGRGAGRVGLPGVGRHRLRPLRARRRLGRGSSSRSRRSARWRACSCA